MDKRTLYQLVTAISSAAEYRDAYTSMHQSHVSNLARCIAQELALSEEIVECVRIAATLHDIGKLGVPLSILTKVGKLREEEFALIKLHPVIGYDILKNIDFDYPVALAVRQHHERLNGSGYPDGLTSEEILLEAKIIAVADVVESMQAARPYRKALGINTALEEISHNKGILYDADVVDACIKLCAKMDDDVFISKLAALHQ
ncbi:metal dependent phosphohydrolase [Catenovulum agarivorans DS-2]|uniref:Metal dependent phosphohydrolase n=1 Tax=Catenovulum agarivorans DS-2 TaxID=1328313 RepID=W7QIP7_9ALTE|nr:HD-GYP domain-containing protein [Catenovulum agarivorans]EWH11726.1 metal dependent phosphohydrolase [Catenovulum agarivorans DS-2]